MKIKKDQQKIIGVWRLVSSQQVFHDGTVVDVFGKNPVGYFVFTPESIMSVQIMRRDRENFHGDHLLRDYLAYTGHYILDEQKKIVIFHVETSLSADYFGKEIKRGYHFENDRLELKVLESENDYRVTWERV